MTRSINIGRGGVGQARLPRQLPDSGAGLVHRATTQALAEFRGALEKRAERDRVEQDKISTAQSKGQLKLAGQALNDIGLSIEEQLQREPESTFRSEQGVENFRAKIEEGIDNRLGQFQEQNPFNDDAALVYDNELPAFRAGLSSALERGAAERTRNILRADAGRDATLRIGAVETFEDVENLAAGLFEHVFTPELFSESEAQGAFEVARQQGYHVALRKAYDMDPVEGATLALELPEDDPNPAFREFVRSEQEAAQRVLEGEYDPIKGAYGFQTLLEDIAFTAADRIEVAKVPGAVFDIWENKQARITAKRMAFHADRQTIDQVFKGDKAATTAIADNFRVVQTQLDRQEAIINLSIDMLSGRVQSAGPKSPLTNEAAEMAATLGGRLEAMDLIEDDRLYAREFVNNITSLNTFTESYGNKLVQMFTNPQNPKMQARAATTFGALHRRGDWFMDGPGKDTIPDQMAMQMLMIDNQILHLEIDPATAAKDVFERTRNVDLVDRDETFNELHKPNQLEKLEGLANSWLPFTDTKGLEIPQKMLDDFTELTRIYHGLSDGNIGLSRKYAFAQMQGQKLWGVTRDANTGPPRWAHRPPELMYQGQGGNAGWIGPDFQADAEKAVGRRIEKAFLVSIDNPKDPSKPVYAVMEIRDGAPLFVETLKSTLGKPDFLFYFPDFKTSPAGKAEAAALLKIRTRAPLPALAVLRRQLTRSIESVGQLRSNLDIQFLGKATTTLALIDEVEKAAFGKDAVTLDEFVKVLESFKSRVPLTNQELERRGVVWSRWAKGAALFRIKESKIELLEVPQNPERELP